MTQVQALRGIINSNPYYLVHLSVSILKEMETTTDSVVIGSNQLLCLTKENMMWVEVELERNEDSFFHSGFLEISDFSKFKSNLLMDISELNDTDNIPVMIVKGF